MCETSVIILRLPGTPAPGKGKIIEKNIPKFAAQNRKPAK